MRRAMSTTFSLNKTEKVLLWLGILGAAVMYAGDMLLYGDLANADVTPEGLIHVMRGMEPARLMAGGAIGPLAGVLYGIGFFGVAGLIRDEHRKLRATIILLFCLALAYGGAYHSHYPNLTFSALAEGNMVFQATSEYVTLLTMGAVVPMAAASFLFLYAVLRGRTTCHKAVALFSPLPLILLSFPMQMLPPPFLTVIAGGWNNLLFIIFFLTCLRFAGNSAPAGSGGEGQTATSSSLADLTQNEAAVIREIRCLPQVTERLAAMGLLPGCAVTVRQSGRTPVIECRGTFIAVSRQFARRIAVDTTAEAEIWKV